MSFDVNLGFKVTTDGLNETITAIDKLATSVGKFNKAELDAEKASQAAAKTAKAEAEAREAVAKAIAAENRALKSKEELDKAAALALKAEIALNDKNTISQERKAKATNAASQAQVNVAQTVGVSTTVLDRQKDVLDFMTEGFSRGQASTLAYAKASGLAANELKELGQVLQTQRKLIGGDPFDKSTSGLLSLQTQYKETQVAIAQYNAQTGLTKQQTRELSRDYERLTTQMLSQGRSLGDITSALDQHTQKYIAVATELNKLTRAEKEHERVQRESANATRAVSKEEERMISIMNSLNNQTNANASFSEKAAIAEANYARNLRLAGVSADDAAKRLGAYRLQQIAVAAEEEKRQAKFLQRGLQPQIGDTVVSLAGGQNPLTVLLQQGDQIRGLIAQSGLQGEALAASMRAAFTGTIESIKQTATAMSSVLGGAIVGVGKILGDVVMGPIRGFREGAAQATADGAVGFSKLSTIIQSAFSNSNTALMAALPLALGSAAVAVGLLGFAFIKVGKELDVMSEALIRNGATLGLSKDAAIEFAKSFDSVGISTSRATDFITAFAKQGSFTKEELKLIIPVAEQMRVVFGDSIEDIVKSFSKLKDDPVKALYELAKQTGMVSIEVIRLVEEQVKLGNISAATALAVEEGAAVNAVATAQMRKDYSTLGTVILKASALFDTFWGNVKGLVYEESATDKIIKKMSELSVKINAEKDGWLGSKSALEKYSSAYSKLATELVSIKVQGAASEEYKRGLVEQTRAMKELGEAAKSAETPLEKYKRVVSETTTKMQAAKGETKALADGQLVIAKAQKEYNDSLEKGNKPSKEARALAKQAIKDEEVYGNLIAKSVDFTSTYSEEVQALNRYAKEAKLTQEDYNKAYFALLEKQPYFINLKKEEEAAIKDASDAIELEGRLLGKADDLGKDYYSTIVKIGVLHGKGVYNPDQVIKLVAALNEATPAARKLSKEWEDVANMIEKRYTEAIAKSKELDDAVALESQALVFQATLIGKTDAERKKAIKTREVEIARAKELAAIDKMDDTNSKPGEKDNLRAAAEKRYLERMKNLNKEIAIDSADQLMKEIDGISQGISDVITTALFEGGAAGGKKLRETLTAQLRKPIQMSVEVAIKNLLTGEGSFKGSGPIGELLGGLVSSTAGGNSSGSLFGAGSTFGKFNLGGATQSITDFGLKLEGVSNDALSNFGTDLVQNAGTIAKGFGQVTTALGYIDALSKFKSGSYGAAIGQGIGLYFGGTVGAAIGEKIGALVDKYFGGKGGPKQESGFGSGIKGVSDSAFNGQNNAFAKGISENVTQAYNDIAKTLGLTVKDLEVSVFTSVDSAGDALSQLQVIAKQAGVEISNRSERMGGSENVGRTPEELDAAIKAEVNTILLAALQASDLPQKYKDYIEGATDISAAVNTVAALQQLDKAIESLGSTFKAFTGMSIEAGLEMINAFGGVEAMMNSLSSYYENFYSEAERQAVVVKSVEGAFSKLGLTMPDITKGSEAARAEFRKLVEAQDLTTESGRANYAALLQLSNTFAALTPSIEASNTAVKETIDLTAQQISQQRDSLQQTLDKLDAELFAAQNEGNLEAIRNRERATIASTNMELQNAIYARQDEISAIRAAAAEQTQRDNQNKALLIQLWQAEGNLTATRNLELSALDANGQALQNQIWALNDAKAASDALAAAEATRASQNRSLVMQLWQLEGNTTAIRQAELEALDPANRALQLRIWAIEDERAAVGNLTGVVQGATAATNDLANAEASRASENRNLMMQLWQIEGNVAAIRREELNAIDPANRAIQLRIWALQDEKVAVDAAAQAQQQAMQEMQQARAAIDNERYGLETQLLQLQGKTLALRQRELDKLDPTNRALQKQIWAMEDAKAAADAVASASTNASDSQNGYADAILEASKFLTDAAENIAAYFSNLRATDDTYSPAQKARVAAGEFERQFALAAGGDRDALAGITQSADNYIKAFTDNASSSDQVKGLINSLEGRLTALPKMVRPEQLIVDAINASSANYTSVSSSQNNAVVSEIGSLNDQIEVELTTTSASSIEKLITYVTETDRLPDDLKKLALAEYLPQVEKQLALVQASGMDQDLKIIALKTNDMLRRTIELAVGSGVTDEFKALALKTNDTLVRTFSAVLGLSDDRAVKVAASTSEVITKTIQAALGSADEQALLLASVASNSFTRTVNLVKGDVTPENRELALKTNDTLSRVISLAAGVVNPEARALALKEADILQRTLEMGLSNNNPEAIDLARKQSDNLLRIVTAAMSNTSDPDALAFALRNNDTFVRTMQLTLGYSSPAAMSVLTIQSDTITRTVQAALGSGNMDAVNLALSGSGYINKIVTAALGSTDPDAVSLALRNSETINKIINTVVTGGQLTPAQQSIIDLLNGDIIDTVKLDAALTLAADSNFTTTLANTIAGVIGTSFDKLDTSVNGLLDDTELKAALGPLATNTNMDAIYKLLDANGDGQISKLEAVRENTESLKVGGPELTQISDFNKGAYFFLSDIRAYLKEGYSGDGGTGIIVKSANRDTTGAMQVFAKGAGFTNGIVKDPTMFNIGQMGEAGPEAIVPLSKTSDGSLGVTMRMPAPADTMSDTASLRSELRALRQEMKASLFAVAKNTSRTYEQLARWDDGDRMAISINQEAGEVVKTETA